MDSKSYLEEIRFKQQFNNNKQSKMNHKQADTWIEQ